MSTKIKYSPVRLEKLNLPYFCIQVGLSKGKNATCFLSSNISVFPRKTTFSISLPGINLASPSQAENRSFSFDSRVTFIECRKVVIQPTFGRTLPCPEKHNYRKIVLCNVIIWQLTKAECSDVQFNGWWKELTFLPCAISQNSKIF